MEQQQVNRFAIADVSAGVGEVQVLYDDGFTEVERQALKAKYREIDKRDKDKFSMTLEEQIIVIKHARIQRTEVFILNPPKVAKAKATRVAKEPKAPKVKKLTKKDQTRLDTLKYLLSEEILTEDVLSPDDKMFWELNKFRLALTEVENVTA